MNEHLFCQTGPIFEILFSENGSWRTVLLCSILISLHNQRARCKMRTKNIQIHLQGFDNFCLLPWRWLQQQWVGARLLWQVPARHHFSGMANIPCVPECSMSMNLCCFSWTIWIRNSLGSCNVVIKFWKTFNSLTDIDVDNALI